MVSLVVVRVPNRLRCLPSKAGAGFSRWQMWDQRHMQLMLKGWTGAEGSFPDLCTLAARKARAGIQREDLWMDQLCQQTPSPSDWYLRTLVPGMSCHNRGSTSLRSVSCSEWEPYSVLFYGTRAIFTHWNCPPGAHGKGWKAGKVTHFQSFVVVFLVCVYV